MEKKEQCIKDKNHVVLYLQDHKTIHLPQPIYKTKANCVFAANGQRYISTSSLNEAVQGGSFEVVLVTVSLVIYMIDCVEK